MTSNDTPEMVYADNAATTRLSQRAYESMLPFLRDNFGNPSQPYAFSRDARRAIKTAREAVAQHINAEPEEIYFTSGGTESDNWAIKGFSLRDATTKVLATSQIEHHAVLNSVESMGVIGHRIHLLPVDSGGTVDLSAAEKIDFGDNGLMSLMFANNEIGTMQPIKQACDFAHEQGAFFHTDAVQAVGHVPINVKDLGVDMLSASAHKFNGPRGIGFLYVKKGTPLSAYASGGAQEMGLRAGTENTAAIVGLAAALEENCSQMNAAATKLYELEKALVSHLTLKQLIFRRNGINQLPGLLSLSFYNASGEMLLHRLDLMKVYVSTGSACDGSTTQISHVLKAIGLEEKYALGTIRISLGPSSTFSDVCKIADSILKILPKQTA
ncbi:MULTISPECIES: cysteine desulfurase family protein [Eggerthella]|uniref:cysteine desulfurase family protein n=1 Tax=Eggerthella TaxID=84111 RepID=UPI001C69BD8D|nr:MULTISPECIES: cysteine desulfurase family protein [Eggerthella]MDU5064038.1 cysteine desulfurase family protein [Eggerthella sp.]